MSIYIVVHQVILRRNNKKRWLCNFFFIYLICFTLVVAFVLVDNETDDDKLGSFSGILGAGWIWLGHKTSGRTFDR